MEVAGQWRREWAGTAEYGKVTEGGVTRRVARAMEVLHASAPGARVRVMRAAYHSTSGPGVPASSYLMHSSRQYLSSGNRFLESPSTPTKPLEISSTPLESHDSENEREHYKVTEPDDFDISEPSKWKGSSSKHSLRMPSEESSSTDNASIIDLDSRISSNNLLRRSFRRKEDDIYAGHRTNSRVSPLLDAPVALSTLKYTSLLNGSEDWNNRRKSYSFEDTTSSDASLNTSALQGKEKITMDSSTDSGICKSSEIVNDQKTASGYSEKDLFSQDPNTFQDWLSKNRSYKIKPSKIVTNESNSDNITLKSTGKVTLTLPITREIDVTSEQSINSNEENERRTKRVEFCKTELHFAAETGTVNIIATDEKPPPTNDFRKKRSAFIPLNDRFEKSITLFGDRSEQFETMADDIKFNIQNDENTAATKSILKNKIPKPKPYLLGENMGLGNTDSHSSDSDKFSISTPVSLINRQLESGRPYSNKLTPSSIRDIDSRFTSYEALRITNTDPVKHKVANEEQCTLEKRHVMVPIKRITKPMSSLQNNSKTRELRETDLAYFGIYDKKESPVPTQDNLQEEIFHSVKLVQQVSNSVSNSEIDSDDAPEYENLCPSKLVIPTPKPRSKYTSDIKLLNDSRILKPIPERSGHCANEHKEVDVKKYRADNTNTFKEKVYRTKSPKTNTSNSSSTASRMKNEEYSSRHTKKDTSADLNLRDRSTTPLYVNVKNKRVVTPIENSLTKKDRNRKSFKGQGQTSNGEQVKKGSENLSEIPNNLERSHSIKKNKQVFERLATPKGKIKERGEEPISKKKVTSNDNTSANVKDTSEDDACSASDRRKLIESPKLNTNNKLTDIKITKINGKENKRNTPNVDGDKNSGSVKQLKVSKIKQHGLNVTDKTPILNTDSHKKIKKSEYVINYDDKNGTVSSIRKITNGGHKREKIDRDRPVEYKKSNKVASLHHPEHQTVTNKLQAYKSKKSKKSIHRSCQLL